jgi:type 1 glutamine amidotransferase
MREASSYPVYKDKRTTRGAILYIKLGSWRLTWAAPYEKYAVRGETTFPATARRDFSTYRTETQVFFKRQAFSINGSRHSNADIP